MPSASPTPRPAQHGPLRQWTLVAIAVLLTATLSSGALTQAAAPTKVADQVRVTDAGMSGSWVDFDYGEFDNALWAPTLTVNTTLEVPNVAEASLPASAAAGRISHVSDGSRGLWADTGSQWYSLTGDIYNVHAFGATPDDAGEDWTAIQAAINATPNRGGNNPTSATVYLPPGNYSMLDKPLFIRHGVNFVCAGKEATTLVWDSYAGNLVMRAQNNVKSATITGCSFDNLDRATAGGIGLNFSGFYHSSVRDVRVRNVDTCVEIVQPDTEPTYYNVFEDVECRNNRVGYKIGHDANSNRVIGGFVDTTGGYTGDYGFIVDDAVSTWISGVGVGQFDVQVDVRAEADTTVVEGLYMESDGTISVGIQIDASSIDTYVWGNYINNGGSVPRITGEEYAKFVFDDGQFYISGTGDIKATNGAHDFATTGAGTAVRIWNGGGGPILNLYSGDPDASGVSRFRVQNNGDTVITRVLTDTIDEDSTGAGVTIDSVLLKDGYADLALVSQGTCDSSARGQIKAVAGGAGVADILYVCLRDSTHSSYSWVAAATG